MIPKSKLIVGEWYKGKGRNSNVALWDGRWFHTIGRYYTGRYYDQYRHKVEEYWSGETGTFIPEEKLKWR